MPEIQTRPEQPYVAVRARLTMPELSGLGARFAEVFAWLGTHGAAPAGPPFFRYRVIDMTRELEVDAGVPVAAPIDGAIDGDGDGDGTVVADVLPGGRYATLTHTGHPDELLAANKTLLDWAAGQGLRFAMSADEDGERWGGRLEIYRTDPSQDPDMSRWVTELAFLLA
jgi:effector-binding domain-containing protein